MLQLQEQRERVESIGLQVAVVTFESEAIAKLYVEETGLAWPLLLDPERELYRAYGMTEGGWWKIFGPASWWTYIKLLFRGRSLRRPTDNVRQLGGDVLIDPQGNVQIHHVGATPADRPEVETLLSHIEKVKEASPKEK